ncbi:MAG: Trm112 family protein [Candidatus Aureabacteria bacterium]|nr:Trm112 family protein [Candidatus Auribacterota bacterium]
MIPKSLLEILACPDCKGAVTEENERIVCLKCGRSYPIRDGIPVMLIEESTSPANIR